MNVVNNFKQLKKLILWTLLSPKVYMGTVILGTVGLITFALAVGGC